MKKDVYNKRTTKEIKEIVENLGYKLLNEYTGEKYQRRVIIQDQEGYKYDIQLNSLMIKTPNFVDKRNPFTLSHNIPLWLKKENKSFILLKNNVYKGNKEKLFFQCLREECQEVFDMDWNSVYHGQECPFCRGLRVGKYNNLAHLKPELVKEWDYDKNNKSPEDYTEFTNEKVSWICSKCGHTWDTQISNRSKGTGCPKCADLQKESIVANSLKKYFEANYNAIPEYKILKNPKTGMWLPYDVYIPHGNNSELNGFYIEVHWKQHYEFTERWHRNKKGFEYQKYRDSLKKKFATKNGVYIEIDLRKIKITEQAIEHIENVLEKFS